MTPFLQLIFALIVILFAAKLAGYLATLIKQPSVFGELLVGVILGPSLLDLTHLTFITDIHLGEIIYELGELGVLLLMFLAGLELNLKDITKNSKASSLAGTLGVFFPIALGVLAGQFSSMTLDQSLFLGLSLAATSVSISAQTLMEMGKLKSRVGLGLLAAAVFDDVLVILLLSSFLAFTTEASGFFGILVVFFRMAGFLALSVAIGIFLLPRLIKITADLPISQGTLALSLIILFGYGFAAELLGGMAAITGSFIAGLMFSRTPEKALIDPGMRSLAYSFFVPVFFVSIGLNMDLHQSNTSYLLFMGAIVIIAVISKVFGAGLGAKIGGMTWRESLQIGIGMISRGEVGLIVAKVGLDNQLLSSQAFSAIIVVVLVTTLLTPPLLRLSFYHQVKKNPSLDKVPEEN